MGDPMTQLGVGAIFALMILDRVFVFVGKRKNGGNGAAATGRLVTEVHRIVSKEGTDGGKLVYHRESLSKAIGDLTNAVREMRTEQVETRRALAALAEQITTKT